MSQKRADEALEAARKWLRLAEAYLNEAECQWTHGEDEAARTMLHTATAYAIVGTALVQLTQAERQSP